MKKIVSLLLTFALALSTFAICASAADNKGMETVRLSGANRFETSAVISHEGWNETGAKTVILANGKVFADALSGTSLAYALDAPIMLTKGEILEDSVKKELSTLNCSDVYILGGNVAVSGQIENELKESGFNVTRIFGENRYETSAKIADKLFEITQTVPEEIFLASGENFPDALSISTVAGLKKSPVLYVKNDGSLDKSVKNYIENSNCTSAVVVGGEAVVPKSVFTALSMMNTVERVAGATRYETSLAVYEKYKSLFKSGIMSVASGAAFPDALSGTPLALKYNMPLMLVNNNKDNSKLREQIILANTKKLYVFGGVVSISEKTAEFLSNGKEKTPEQHVFRTVAIKVENCEIYSDAGTKNQVIGTAALGTSYNVLETKDAADGVSWFKINYGSTGGWVSRKVVIITNHYVPIEDKTFSADNKAVIYLSASRQPENPYYNGVTNEQEQMDKLACEIKKILDEEYDCTVYSAKKEFTLVDRMAQAYELGCDIYIAIHSNAIAVNATEPSYGARMYYFTACNQSYQLSKNLVESLGKIAPRASTSSTQIIDGMLYLDNFGYGEVRTPADYGMVSLLAETDYHDNPITGAWLINNTEEIARAYVDGIVKTFNIPKK